MASLVFKVDLRCFSSRAPRAKFLEKLKLPRDVPADDLRGRQLLWATVDSPRVHKLEASR